MTTTTDGTKAAKKTGLTDATIIELPNGETVRVWKWSKGYQVAYTARKHGIVSGTVAYRHVLVADKGHGAIVEERAALSISF